MKFSVSITPKAKERPRFVNGHAYTPKATKDYEKTIATHAKAAGCKPLPNPCIVDITATFKQPKSHKGFRYCTKRPDVDNVAKAITDALNGVAFLDDSQIVGLNVSKNYGERDLVEVEIEYL